MDQYTAQKNQQAAYQRSIGSGLAGQSLGTLHQNGDFEPSQSYGPIGIQTASAQVTLTGQICTAHSMLDRLSEIINGLEKRLAPVLSSNHPDTEKSQGTAVGDPPALEEMERLIARLNIACNYVDSIERRTRI